ncbi:MAG: PAS domain-containing protein [Flavobacteriaceae bacterium]
MPDSRQYYLPPTVSDDSMQLNVLHSIPANIALIDQFGTIAFVNEAWLHFACENGMADDAAGVGANYLAVCEGAFGPDAQDARETAEKLRDVLAGNLPGFSMEYPCHSPMKQRWFQMTVSALRREDGVRAIAMHIDVTDRKLAEIAARERENELRRVSDELLKERKAFVTAQAVANIGSWEIDAATWQVRCSDQTYRIFGFDVRSPERSYEDFLSLVHHEDQVQLNVAIKSSFRSAGPFAIKFRIVRPDGETRHISSQWQVFRGSDGQSDYAVGTCRDVTDLVASEQEVRRYQALVRMGSSVARLGGWSYDSRSRELRWTQEIREIFQVPGRFRPTTENTILLFAPRWRKEILAAERRCLEDGTGYDLEVEIGSTERDRRWVRLIGEAVYDRMGQISGLQGAVQDIDRIHQLTEQLRQAQKLEAVGQLTGGIAHDFNNLLTIIIGNLEMLDARLFNQTELRELIAVTNRAATRGSELTQRLLAFARRQPLQPTTVNLNQLIDDSKELLRRSVMPKNIALEFLNDSQLWLAEVDPHQLETALLNLVINSRDAIEDSGTISIQTSNENLDERYCGLHDDLAPGDYVRIRVTDTGCGMPDDVRARALDPFFTTKPGGTGNGLGLSMVYGFVKQSSGHLVLHSRPGKGTEISIYLPRAREERKTTGPNLRAVPGRSIQTRHILVVEDDPLLRPTVERQIVGLGYRVTPAASGDAALELLDRFSDIDLLFTDVVMPNGISGPELALRATSLRPDLKVLFTSGYPDMAQGAQLSPTAQLLPKPYRLQDLASKLVEVMDG